MIWVSRLDVCTVESKLEMKRKIVGISVYASLDDCEHNRIA